MGSQKGYDIVVVGVSAGGLNALTTILPAFPKDFRLPLVVVQHLGERSDDFRVRYLNGISSLPVCEAEDKGQIVPGVVYLAPPGYHLLIEAEGQFALSSDTRVLGARPSIDVLFESAAYVYGKATIGVALTCANSDGLVGLQAIARAGGLTVVQAPETCEARFLADVILSHMQPDHVVSLDGLVSLLKSVPPGSAPSPLTSF